MTPAEKDERPPMTIQDERYAELKAMLVERQREIMAEVHGKIGALPRRTEYISGQQFSYVKLDDVQAILPTAAPAGEQKEDKDHGAGLISANDTGLGDTLPRPNLTEDEAIAAGLLPCPPDCLCPYCDTREAIQPGDYRYYETRRDE